MWQVKYAQNTENFCQLSILYKYMLNLSILFCIFYDKLFFLKNCKIYSKLFKI